MSGKNRVGFVIPACQIVRKRFFVKGHFDQKTDAL